MLAVSIRGATVIDGTGAPGRRLDLGVSDGMIVELAEPGAGSPATKVIDATELLVTPGFIDLHTHYDAQLLWDPAASPSPLHGVTTVIGGNCGFSLAPLSGADDARYVSRMMARVEGMPLAALEGLDWDWSSFGSWLERLDGSVAVNAGFLVGHSTLRRAVLGDAALEECAQRTALDQMISVLEESLAAGALGLSTSRSHTHNDGEGNPVPSRFAGRGELEDLCCAVSRHAGTTLELIVPGCLDGFSEEEVELMGTLSLLAQRPVNWNVLGVSALNPGAVDAQLAASDAAAARGGTVVALTLPHTMRLRLSFEFGAILDGLPGWRELFGLPIEQRVAALTDPATRRRLDDAAHSKEAGILGALANWQYLVFEETFDESTAPYEGRSVGEVAAERAQSPFDALCDVVVADRLRTGLRPPIPESEQDWVLRAKVWQDPRTVVGGSDAGAHLDVMCGAIYTTSMLKDGVRERGLLSWEQAVHQLTKVPASLYGLRQRGRIAEGYRADLVVLDPTRVGYGPERTLDDLPGGASRLFAGAVGIEHVFVNGVEVVSAGNFTGALPGTVLRSGRDSHSVEVPWRPA